MEELEGYSVVPLQQLVYKNAYILILNRDWMPALKIVMKYIPEDRIFCNCWPWNFTKGKCVACENTKLLAGPGYFYPFLVERMFLGEEKRTRAMYCPKCGICYSEYRPNDDEMDRLYEGYRDSKYQKQRQKYEPEYTEAFNRELYAPSDGGEGKRERIFKYISDQITLSNCHNILDYGGDRGQFIPGQFVNAKKYVYEISHPTVIDGIELIEDKMQLRNIKWDVIFCNQTLEHLSEVKTYFTELVSYMSEGTLLYIEVPNDRPVDYYDPIFFHEHINHFSLETFKNMAKANGAKMIKGDVGGVIRCIIKK